MFKFVFKTASGRKYTAEGRDADRARVAAKAQAVAAGDNWTGAKLVGLTNSIGA